jgi:hypothetical protein
MARDAAILDLRLDLLPEGEMPPYSSNTLIVNAPRFPTRDEYSSSISISRRVPGVSNIRRRAVRIKPEHLRDIRSHKFARQSRLRGNFKTTSREPFRCLLSCLLQNSELFLAGQEKQSREVSVLDHGLVVLRYFFPR